MEDDSTTQSAVMPDQQSTTYYGDIFTESCRQTSTTTCLTSMWDRYYPLMSQESNLSSCKKTVREHEPEEVARRQIIGDLNKLWRGVRREMAECDSGWDAPFDPGCSRSKNEDADFASLVRRVAPPGGSTPCCPIGCFYIYGIPQDEFIRVDFLHSSGTYHGSCK